MLKFDMKIIASILIVLSLISYSEDNSKYESTIETITNRIFLPAFNIGYISPSSELLDGSEIIKTSIEYRIRNNNDLFLRLTYDTYNSKYNLTQENQTTNTIEGTAHFSDLYLGAGYRFGDETFRFLLCFSPGLKFYEFPIATIEGNTVIVNQKSRSVLTSSFLSSLEIYFDEKSALTVNLFQNQVWEQIDFWESNGSAFGFSIGFITALK